MRVTGGATTLAEETATAELASEDKPATELEASIEDAWVPKTADDIVLDDIVLDVAGDNVLLVLESKQATRLRAANGMRTGNFIFMLK